MGDVNENLLGLPFACPWPWPCVFPLRVRGVVGVSGDDGPSLLEVSAPRLGRLLAAFRG